MHRNRLLDLINYLPSGGKEEWGAAIYRMSLELQWRLREEDELFAGMSELGMAMALGVGWQLQVVKSVCENAGLTSIYGDIHDNSDLRRNAGMASMLAKVLKNKDPHDTAIIVSIAEKFTRDWLVSEGICTENGSIGNDGPAQSLINALEHARSVLKDAELFDAAKIAEIALNQLETRVLFNRRKAEEEKAGLRDLVSRSQVVVIQGK